MALLSIGSAMFGRGSGMHRSHSMIIRSQMISIRITSVWGTNNFQLCQIWVPLWRSPVVLFFLWVLPQKKPSWWCVGTMEFMSPVNGGCLIRNSWIYAPGFRNPNSWRSLTGWWSHINKSRPNPADSKNGSVELRIVLVDSQRWTQIRKMGFRWFSLFLLDRSHYTALKINMVPNVMKFGRWFTFSNSWFSGEPAANLPRCSHRS